MQYVAADATGTRMLAFGAFRGKEKNRYVASLERVYANKFLCRYSRIKSIHRLPTSERTRAVYDQPNGRKETTPSFDVDEASTVFRIRFNFSS